MTQADIKTQIQARTIVQQAGLMSSSRSCGSQCDICGQYWLYTTQSTCNCCSGGVGCVGCGADTCWVCRKSDIDQFGADENCSEHKLSKRCHRCHRAPTK